MAWRDGPVEDWHASADSPLDGRGDDARKRGDHPPGARPPGHTSTWSASDRQATVRGGGPGEVFAVIAGALTETGSAVAQTAAAGQIAPDRPGLQKQFYMAVANGSLSSDRPGGWTRLSLRSWATRSRAVPEPTWSCLRRVSAEMGRRCVSHWRVSSRRARWTRSGSALWASRLREPGAADGCGRCAGTSGVSVSFRESGTAEGLASCGGLGRPTAAGRGLAACRDPRRSGAM
jgi:hypothetical protein